VPEAARPKTSLFTAPSICTLLYRLLRPATEIASGSSLSDVAEKYGETRTMSTRLRAIVGRFCTSTAETLSAAPARELSMIDVCPTTSTVSASVSSCSLKSSARCSPSFTSMSCCTSSRNPLITTFTVYGPTRMFRMLYRPCPSVTAS
jgi:hypothetical protein